MGSILNNASVVSGLASTLPRVLCSILGTLLAIVLLGSPARGSTQAGQLAGIVTAAASGVPLRGAEVRIEETGRTTRTNPIGRFAFQDLSEGRYTISVRMMGYAPHREVVRVVAAGGQWVTVQLAAAAFQLPAMEVLRERTQLARHADDIAGSIHVVERADLDASSLLFDDIHEILRQVPGVNLQEEDGFGLRPNIGMRGTGSERSAKITLMEDGVLIAPAPYAAPAAYYFPIVGRMETIEVRKGSSQIKYGPRTIGGAINLISSSIPDRLAVAVDLVGGEQSTRKLTARVGDSYDNVGWLLETYQIETDGFKQLDGPGDVGFDLANYVAKVRLNSSPLAATYQELELKVGYYDERSDETYLGLTDSDFASTPLRRYAASQADVMNAEHRQLQARYFLRPSHRFDITTTIYRNDFKRNWYKLQSVLDAGIAEVVTHPADFAEAFAVLRGADSERDALLVRANDREYFSHGVETVVGITLGNSALLHALEVGARYHEDGEDRLQQEDAFQMANGTMIRSSAGPLGSQANRVNSARALSFYAQDEIAVGSWLFTPGVRYEAIDLIREDYPLGAPVRSLPDRVRRTTVRAVIPGMSASYQLQPGARVFAGLHRGFGPPGPGAEEATKPERSLNYELGVRFDARRVHAEVVGFFNDYSNILGAATLATGADGSGDLFNGGEVDVWGVEASIDYAVAPSSNSAIIVPLGATATYTSAEFKTAFKSDYEPWGIVRPGDELPYLPRLQFHTSVGVASRPAGWDLRLSGTYTGAMRTVAGQGAASEPSPTDAVFVIDASGEIRFASIGTLFLGIRNLFNAHYIVARRPAGARPGLPRSVLAGLKLRR